jgi:type IV secretory pathway component VirB8
MVFLVFAIPSFTLHPFMVSFKQYQGNAKILKTRLPGARLAPNGT